jgi:hypothetical protein
MFDTDYKWCIFLESTNSKTLGTNSNVRHRLTNISILDSWHHPLCRVIKMIVIMNQLIFMIIKSFIMHIALQLYLTLHCVTCIFCIR